MSTASVRTRGVATGITSEAVVASAFASLAITYPVRRALGVVVSLVVTIGNVSPGASRQAGTLGAVERLVPWVARAEIMLAAGTLARAWDSRKKEMKQRGESQH